MCGIAGYINLDGKPVDLQNLKRMNECISHRGPDGEGYYCEGPVGFAHRRLAIIDPHGGVQPFYSDDRSLVMVFNGEVYNYVEIRKELEPYFPFHTDSDTEVVLKAYQKWGLKGALERFQGMFAFALYDVKEAVVYIVRDRVGIKPLYYYLTSNQLVFASEIQAILRAGNVKREIVPESIASYLRYQYIPAPGSIYKDLHKLQPGCSIKIDIRTGRVEKTRYWQLEISTGKERAENEWLEEFNALMDAILKIYVRSDVPFGAFLSGGVDSSLVAAVMSRHLDHPVRTFTIGFQEEKHSETPFALDASRMIGADHLEKIVSPNLAEELLVGMTRHFGEPFGDSSAIPTYYVSKVAASRVKMVLSGDGGDELFGGYNSYQTTFRNYTNTFECLRVAAKLKAFASTLFYREDTKQIRTRIEQHQAAHDSQREGFSTPELTHLLSTGMPVPPRTAFTPAGQIPDIDPITWFQAQDFHTYMVDDVLTKVDRMSMANSLEVRVPLLDHKVVEFAFSLPLSLKIRADQTGNSLITKYLLKKSAARFYPEAFLARPKQGFGIPIVEWCRGAFRPLIESTLRDRSNPIFEWLNFDMVKNILDEFFSTNPNRVVQVWYLFMLSMWVKHVHEQP